MRGSGSQGGATSTGSLAVLLCTVLSCLLAGCGGRDGSARAPAAHPRPPNFVILLTDDQGYQDLGCFGSPTIKTPEIDRMAEEGVRFTSFYAGYSICTPSRAALMTGCYAERVGFGDHALDPFEVVGLHPAEVTLAEVLRGRGDATSIGR